MLREHVFQKPTNELRNLCFGLISIFGFFAKVIVTTLMDLKHLGSEMDTITFCPLEVSFYHAPSLSYMTFVKYVQTMM